MRIFIGILLSAFLLSPLPMARAIPFFDQLPKFKVRVQDDQQLQDWLREQMKEQRKGSSVLKTYDDPRDVARYERGTLEKLLRSRGYYDASVRQTVTDGEILYRVNPGPQYHIKSIVLDMPDYLRQGFSGLPLQVGDPLVASKVLEGVKTIEKYLHENTCLLNVDVSYEATAIHSEAAARLVYRVAPSPEVNVGEVRLEGLTSVEADYLQGKLKIQTGDCFSREKIDAARLRLLRTNLIASANSEVSEPYQGLVDVTFVVQERRHRTVKLGVGYTSDEGAGVSAGWEHRNVFRRGEKIEVESKVNPAQQTLKGKLLIPRFLHDKQKLTGSVEVGNEERDSYRSESIKIGATVSRDLSRNRTASIGTELKFSQVDEEVDVLPQQDKNKNFRLLAFPLGLKWDTTDNPLDARRGATVAMEVKPYLDLKNSNTSFVKNTLLLTGYKTGRQMRYEPTLALRIKAGAITGVPNLELPADERFYAGGGGSVRGYGYQELGPRVLVPPAEPGGQPTLSDSIGGRGLSEISLEGRFRFSDTWGGVLFVDGGNAYEEPRPKFSDLFWGAGFGVRYFTSFAPLRLDIAFPLDKREGIDSDYQIYVSLGQAF
ncbi:autotransporter secretion outer membrane protein TamA [Microbulbifer donghaiensis]|uniref:Autotransporter secretion outer membrane protein TamA n=1 Tax=Microbulbifer donghaiensis TaxID=494016 RepID=A0A1M5H5M7_9GAMM|nr:BamA/TamA family outer membrane protein [Microbulbifer donghaiensis]SHG11193.1 autotransporter secretion outer membrane protein TamA [Microbulbifer donghaiensis]